MDEHADEKMDWTRTFAFRDAHVEPSPFVNSMSDIDGHQVNVPGRRQPLGTFTLFDFSAKFDPVASMLVQDHRAVIPDFYGVTTSFMRRTLKPGVTILAEEGRAVGEVHPRRLRQGNLDVPRRARSRGSAARDRQSADGSVAASELAGLSADPEQRPLPGGEEEAAEDVSTPLAAREPSSRYGGGRWQRRVAPRAARPPLRCARRSGSRAGARCASSRRSTTRESCARRAWSRAATCRACSRCRRWRERGEMLAAQPSVGTARAVGCRSRRRAATARRRHRLRHHRQRRDASSTSSSRFRRRGSSRADRRERRGRCARARRSDRRDARALRGSARAARDGERDRDALQRRRRRRCSRRAPASASRSAISFPRCAGRRRTASARSSRRTRSTCRSSSSARICRFSRDALTDQPVRFALLKGWRNYLCLYRLEQATSSAPGAVRRMASRTSSRTIRAWAERTSDGSLARSADAAARRGVGRGRGGAGSLPAAQVPVLRQVLSLQGAARGGAGRRRSSSIIICCCRDLAVRRASAELGRRRGASRVHAARSSTRGIISRMPRRRTSARRSRIAGCSGSSRGSSGAARGCSSALAHKLESQKRSAEHREPRSAAVRISRRRCTRARDRATLVFDSARSRICSASNEPVARLTPAFATHPIWRGGLARVARRHCCARSRCCRTGSRLVRERMEANGPPREGVASLLYEMRGVARRLESAGDALQRALVPAPGDETSLVRWLEVRGRERNVAATAVPLDSRRSCARICSSASTHRGRHERDARDRRAVRLRRARSSGSTSAESSATSAVFPSPFDYPTQAMLAVPTRLPGAERRSGRASAMRVVRARSISPTRVRRRNVRAVHQPSRRARGRARAARARHRASAGRCSCTAKSRATCCSRRFRESGARSSSAPRRSGKASTCPASAARAVIAKLPFRVPTEPLTAAQCEAIEARGGDSFDEYMLPHAALRLKQGFGRLIRTGTDRGVRGVMPIRGRSTKAIRARHCSLRFRRRRRVVGAVERCCYASSQ